MRKKLLTTSVFGPTDSKITEHVSKDCEVVYEFIEKYLKKKSDNS
jgi:hypothetical protein